MDLRSKSFLAVSLILLAIAVFAFVEGLIPVGIIFAVFGVGGLLARFMVKKK